VLVPVKVYGQALQGGSAEKQQEQQQEQQQQLEERVQCEEMLMTWPRRCV
jgi:hypothetical protein